jgi:hypothetical protein
MEVQAKTVTSANGQSSPCLQEVMISLLKRLDQFMPNSLQEDSDKFNTRVLRNKEVLEKEKTQWKYAINYLHEVFSKV